MKGILILVLALIVVTNSQEVKIKKSDKLSNDVVKDKKVPLDKLRPQALYLQGWAKKFTELEDIPLCKDAPKKSHEETLIEAKCPPKGDAPTICLNIRLFTVFREMCFNLFEQNKAKFINVMDAMVSEEGLNTFVSSTTDREVYDRIEQETGMKLSNFQKRNIAGLWLDHIVELIHAEQ